MYRLEILIFLLLVLAGCGSGTSANSAGAEVERMLITQEELKWEILSRTRDFARLERMLAPDFVSIQYAAAPERVHRALALQSMARLPRTEGTLSDVEVIRPSDDSAILTYRLDLHSPDGPLAAYATSVWARRDGEWKTVFQQTTAIP